jgi:hypothetical protein
VIDVIQLSVDYTMKAFENEDVDIHFLVRMILQNRGCKLSCIHMDITYHFHSGSLSYSLLSPY